MKIRGEITIIEPRIGGRYLFAIDAQTVADGVLLENAAGFMHVEFSTGRKWITHRRPLAELSSKCTARLRIEGRGIRATPKRNGKR